MCIFQRNLYHFMPIMCLHTWCTSPLSYKQLDKEVIDIKEIYARNCSSQKYEHRISIDRTVRASCKLAHSILRCYGIYSQRCTTSCSCQNVGNTKVLNRRMPFMLYSYCIWLSLCTASYIVISLT
jgi:hypothetical protein